jgi:hypothetical protein
MRLLHSFILAGALVAAAPAVAQDNAAAPANAAEANAAAPAPAADTNAATPDLQNGQVPPPNVATPADTGATMAVKTHSGFPWGVVGLLGLIGLFGVRKVKS